MRRLYPVCLVPPCTWATPSSSTASRGDVLKHVHINGGLRKTAHAFGHYQCSRARNRWSSFRHLSFVRLLSSSSWKLEHPNPRTHAVLGLLVDEQTCLQLSALSRQRRAGGAMTSYDELVPMRRRPRSCRERAANCTYSVEHTGCNSNTRTSSTRTAALLPTSRRVFD